MLALVAVKHKSNFITENTEYIHTHTFIYFKGRNKYAPNTSQIHHDFIFEDLKLDYL